MLKIWGRANSINVKKVLWCASELHLEFDRIDAGGKFGIVDSEEFRSMNPNGLVPCIEDDGFVLWESNAIVRYLTNRHGEESMLLPATLEERASADRWMDWASLTMMAHYTTLIVQLVRTAPEQRNHEAIAKAADVFANALKIANRELEETPWFSGQSFGIGDIPLGALAYSWSIMPGLERPTLPALEEWLQRLGKRPAFIQWLAIPLT